MHILLINPNNPSNWILIRVHTCDKAHNWIIRSYNSQHSSYIIIFQHWTAGTILMNWGAETRRVGVTGIICRQPRWWYIGPSYALMCGLNIRQVWKGSSIRWWNYRRWQGFCFHCVASVLVTLARLEDARLEFIHYAQVKLDYFTSSTLSLNIVDQGGPQWCLSYFRHHWLSTLFNPYVKVP